VPIVLYRAYLPDAVQVGAETAVGAVIVGLALSLLVRWHRGAFGPHAHPRRTRTRAGAFAIGLVHGIGGSCGVGVLLLAAIHSHAVALVALALFAACTALSMATLSTGFGYVLARPPLQRAFARVVPAFGVMGVCFGCWYALGALTLVPYVL